MGKVDERVKVKFSGGFEQGHDCVCVIILNSGEQSVQLHLQLRLQLHEYLSLRLKHTVF